MINQPPFNFRSSCDLGLLSSTQTDSILAFFPFFLFYPRRYFKSENYRSLSVTYHTAQVGRFFTLTFWHLSNQSCCQPPNADRAAFTQNRNFLLTPRDVKSQRQLRRRPLRAFVFVPGAILQIRWASQVISAVSRLELVIITLLVHGHRPAWSS